MTLEPVQYLTLIQDEKNAYLQMIYSKKVNAVAVLFPDFRLDNLPNLRYNTK